jgi:hypothetical protein
MKRQKGTVFFLHFIEFYDHIRQREQTLLHLYARIRQPLVISLQVAVGDHYGLGYMGAQIVRAAAGIAFSEHVVLSIYAALQAAEKNKCLVYIIPMGKVDRQNFKARVADNFKSLFFERYKIGNTIRRFVMGDWFHFGLTYKVIF